MMKPAALLLVLAFGILQGVSVTDCPCGSLCETKNACPDEQKHESPDDCCSRTRAADPPATENCFHLEPQTDLDRTSIDLDPAPLLIVAVVDRPTLAVLPIDEQAVVSGSGLPPPRSPVPLFLLHGSLII